MKNALWPLERHVVVRAGICVVFGTAIAFTLAPASMKNDVARAVVPDLHPPVVRLRGKVLPSGSEAEMLEAARAIVRAYVNEPVTLEIPTAAPEKRTRGELGAHVDSARLASLVHDAKNPDSALRRAHDQVTKQLQIARKSHDAIPLDLPMPVMLDEARAHAAMLDVKDALDKNPQDARLDLENKRVIADARGRRVDLYATISHLDSAIERGDEHIAAVVEDLPAARVADGVKNVAIDDVLGYFETKYARDQKHEARSYNLRLAAKHLDGHVIFPGETFDFNEVVGPRDEANGYKVAPVIAQGELVDGIGGGTCQIAGTLHGAAYFAGLDIVERKPHTRPSFYIKMGMDATVVYPTITLKIRNPFSFPVVLHETVEDGVVHAEILGLKRTRDVTFVRKINDVVPFVERDIEDAKVPRGKRSLAQRGIPGFKITRYRILRDGAFAVRERSQDVYPPTQQIWRVGTGEPDPDFVSHDDEHPEYVADEYLQISQGPDVHDPRGHTPPQGGATVESRVAGKYGTHGWTLREGFSKPGKASRSGTNSEDSRPGTD